MSILSVLKSSDVFGSFEEAELVPLERAMELRTYEDGEVLIREGEPGRTFFLIVRGDIEVSRLQEGTRVVLGTMKEGEIFGLISLVDDKPRSATCTARGQVEVACLPQAAFKLLHGADTRWGLHFQKMVTKQLARDARALSGALLSAMLEASERPSAEPSASLSYDFQLVVPE